VIPEPPGLSEHGALARFDAMVSGEHKPITGVWGRAPSGGSEGRAPGGESGGKAH